MSLYTAMCVAGWQLLDGNFRTNWLSTRKRTIAIFCYCIQSQNLVFVIAIKLATIYGLKLSDCFHYAILQLHAVSELSDSNRHVVWLCILCFDCILILIAMKLVAIHESTAHGDQ